MKQTLIWGLGVIGLLMLTSQVNADWFWKTSPTTSTAATSLKWEENITSAVTRATNDQKPLLIYVTADFCHFCRKMDKETWSDSELLKVINADFVPVKIVAENNQELIRRMGISAFPTTILLDQTGSPSVIEGYVSASAFTASLQQHRQVTTAIQQSSAK